MLNVNFIFVTNHIEKNFRQYKNQNFALNGIFDKTYSFCTAKSLVLMQHIQIFKNDIYEYMNRLFIFMINR